MQALSAYSFDDYALMYGDMELLPVADTNATNMMLQTQSGKFRIAVTGNPNAFQQALQSKRTFIIFSCDGGDFAICLLFSSFGEQHQQANPRTGGQIRDWPARIQRVFAP